MAVSHQLALDPSRAPAFARHTPRLLGLRDGMGRLELWRWTRESGRARIVTSPCPDCASPIEVGDPAVEGVWALSVEVLRREGGPALNWDVHPEALVDHVIRHLPRERAWSLDGCEVRAWVEGRGVIVPIVGRGQYFADQAGIVRLDRR